MATPTYYYVRPVTGNNIAGQGTTDGTAYQTVQFALDDVGLTHGRNAVSGDQININSEGPNTLAAALSLANYGTPGVVSPLILSGYTTIANDGGIGEIDLNTFNLWAVTTSDWIGHQDLNIHGATNNAIHLDRGVFLTRCEVWDANIGIQLGADGIITASYVHDCVTNAIYLTGDTCLLDSYIEHSQATDAIFVINGPKCFRTVINLSHVGATGIDLRDDSMIVQSSIYNSEAGTGRGISIEDTFIPACYNNVVEGFSGVGGVGIFVKGGDGIKIYGYNAFFNCTTTLQENGNIAINLGGNQILGSSPFTNPATNDFSVDTQLRAAGWPSDFLGSNTNQYLDVGGAQRQEQGILVSPIGSIVVR